MTYHITTLPNGLRVATERMLGAETVSVNVMADVGARHESEAENGLSHFLEHMAFKGTARRTAREIAEAFDDIGGNSNAYTSHEHTVYYARILPDDMPVALDIISDILLHSTFDASEMERERDVILQEIAMQQDMPEEMAFDYFQMTAFPDQPLGRTILGPEERVSNFAREDLSNYVKKHYFPQNIVISAAGKIDHNQFVEQCRELFTFTGGKGAHTLAPATYQGGEYRKKMPWEQLHIFLGFSGTTILDDDYYAMHLLAVILGGGMSSRLFQEVREKRGLVYNVSASHAAYIDCGVFSLYAATGEDKAHEVVPVLCDEVLKLADTLTQAELDRAKKQHLAMILTSKENNASVSEWISRHLTVFGEYRTAEMLRERLEQITLADLKRLAGGFIDRPAVSFTAMGPLGKLQDFSDIQKRFA